MKSKYHSTKIKNIFGTFDSKHEYERFLKLKSMLDEGLISGLERQVKFVLSEGYRKEVVRIRKGTKYLANVTVCKCSYIADFVYITKLGEKVVEDAKGMKTKEYNVKKAWMYEKYGIEIYET